MPKLTRRSLLCATAPLAAVPIGAKLMLGESDYSWVTGRLVEIARDHSRGWVVLTPEGGYDLAAPGPSAASR